MQILLCLVSSEHVCLGSHWDVHGVQAACSGGRENTGSQQPARWKEMGQKQGGRQLLWLPTTLLQPLHRRELAKLSMNILAMESSGVKLRRCWALRVMSCLQTEGTLGQPAVGSPWKCHTRVCRADPAGVWLRFSSIHGLLESVSLLCCALTLPVLPLPQRNGKPGCWGCPVQGPRSLSTAWRHLGAPREGRLFCQACFYSER